MGFCHLQTGKKLKALSFRTLFYYLSIKSDYFRTIDLLQSMKNLKKVLKRVFFFSFPVSAFSHFN